MRSFLKRTWAQVDLDAVEYNFFAIKKHIGPKPKIMCIVKADAYGHGAPKLSKFYEQIGADWLGVSNIEEAIQIREANVSLPILILGYTPANLAGILSENNLTATIVSKQYAEKLNYFAEQYNIKLNVHIKLDTGMSRLGIMCQNSSQIKNSTEEIKQICNLPNLNIEGIFTHMAVADEAQAGRDFTYNQYEIFKKLLKSLENIGINIPIKHCCNSGSVLNFPEFSMDMVRPGIILYGLMPSINCKNTLNLKPAMQLKSIISHIKTISPNTSVSYGRSYFTKQKTKVATVPIGYADGYNRLLSNNSYMLVNGQKAPLIGKICMDQCMIDITNIKNVTEDDIVTVFGTQQGQSITALELANKCNSIAYETICLIGKRVPRVYYKNGNIVGKLNYIVDKF